MSNNNTLWWSALAGWMAVSTWYHVCRIKQLCDAPLASVRSAADQPSELSPLRITDSSSLSLVSPGNFGFAKSGAQANFSGIHREIDSLAVYLKANPEKKLTITGYFSAEETNKTNWPNLGIARAEGIRLHYISQGLPANTFATLSTLQSDIRFSPDSMRGGIDFTFSKLAPVENTPDETQKNGNIFNPLDLYFNTGSADYIKTSENEKFIKQAQNYLSENKNKKLLLTGHADNVGSTDLNTTLSGKRARQVKRLLITAGLPEAQLMTAAKGQFSPKESNNTAKGRAANRRVSIVVQ